MGSTNFRIVCSVFFSFQVVLKLFAATPVAPDVKKIVTFVFVSDENRRLIPRGTAFFMTITDSSGVFGYLISAAHVLRDEQGTFLPRVYLRLNTLAGGSEVLSLDLAASVMSTHPRGKNVFVHRDPSVDLVAIPFLPDPKVFDLKALPVDQFLPKSKTDFNELGIGEGSDVFFTGMFTGFLGTNKNYPISRFGHVSLISNEPILWEENGKPPVLTDLYLIESTSSGGNSGSPMFFYQGADRVPGSLMPGVIMKLAGVVKGKFNNASLPGNTKASSISYENVGISAVVPSYLLYELLFSSELKEQRAREKESSSSLKTTGPKP